MDRKINSTVANNIDAYIAGFPKDVQKVLEQVRSTIKRAAPDAEEAISYAIPTFKYHGNLVHFAAFKSHIGFYATPSGNDVFQKEIAAYKTGRGSIQFPLDQPMPLKLIKQLVEFRVLENEEKAKMKKKPR
ncbi:MAG: DUF1801 domain-containing protein [Chitinophagaceae bacterium]|nr:DUF1801 domain-containing protein [Chitinophagaceae bacterium]